MVTKIKWHDARVRLPKKHVGTYLVLRRTGLVEIVDYYCGLWNASGDTTRYAYDEGVIVAWAKVPKKLREFADQRWEEYMKKKLNEETKK